MAAYFQMGHDTENLVGEPGLESFKGVVLSPVNRPPAELSRYIGEFREKGEFDVVLDPQLYCPRSEHRHLPSHPYFPKDFDTTDLSSIASWLKLAKEVATYGVELGVNAICSPAMLPNRGSGDYYMRCSESYAAIENELTGSPIRPLLTLCVHLSELGDPNDAMRIASIATACNPKSCYLVVASELEPRREIKEAENLASLMFLISALERADCRVLVSHCCSDVLLFKAAGASHCSTGKHFNLRRFTRGRFEEKDDGGRQIPYWYEHGLLAFLREADIARLRRDVNPDFLCVGDSGNLFALQVLEQFANEPGKAWLGLSWRQYLAWFGAVENRLSGTEPIALVNQWLREAEERWMEIEDKGALFQETRNDGSWIRRWRQALGDFRKFDV